MDRKTKRSMAVVAGLTAVLALSPVAGPLTTALADEGTSTDSTVEQTTDGISTRSFLGWHYGNSDCWHLYIATPSGTCFFCGAPYWDGCKPDQGGDDQKPDQSVEAAVVSFKMNYPADATGTGEDYSVKANENGYIEAPSDPTCDGYEFVAWAKNGNTTFLYNSRAVGNQKYTPGVTYTYTAQWKKIEDPVPVTHTVTFDDLVEDTQDQVVTVDAGMSVNEAGTEVADPTREGYSFQGWYTSTDYTTEFSFDAAINEDTTVYAKWAENSTEEPGGETPGTEKPDTETPDTDAEQPGTGTEDSNTDNEKPGTGTEQPGTGTENPSTDTEQPGTGTETPDADDNVDVVTPNDNADANNDAADDADKSDDASKKADETTNEDKSAAEDKSADEDALPSTGDASVAVSGIAALGTAVAGLGAFLRRRR